MKNIPHAAGLALVALLSSGILTARPEQVSPRAAGIGSAGLLYPLDADATSVGEPVSLDLGGFAVEYSGSGLSVPRTGTPVSDVMDVVFPSGGGTRWIYFRLDLSATVE